MPRSSNVKGGEYEREIARRLSRWISKGARLDLFWRSAMSGGVSTIRRRGREAEADSMAGDLVGTDELGQRFLQHWCVECKHRNWHQSLPHMVLLREQQRGPLEEFWRGACAQSPPGREPLLFCRISQYGEFGATTPRGFEILQRGAAGSRPFHPVVTVHHSFSGLPTQVCYSLEAMFGDVDWTRALARSRRLLET